MSETTKPISRVPTEASTLAPTYEDHAPLLAPDAERLLAAEHHDDHHDPPPAYSAAPAPEASTSEPSSETRDALHLGPFSKEEREYEWELRKALKEAREGESRTQELDKSIASVTSPESQRSPLRLRPAQQSTSTTKSSKTAKEQQLESLRLRSTSLSQGSAMRAHGIVTGRIPEQRIPNVVEELVVDERSAEEMRRQIVSLGGEGEGVGMSGIEIVVAEERDGEGGKDSKAKGFDKVKKVASAFLSGGGVSPI